MKPLEWPPLLHSGTVCLKHTVFSSSTTVDTASSKAWQPAAWPGEPGWAAKAEASCSCFLPFQEAEGVDEDP